MSTFKIVYYVPDSHLEATKQALFASGAGTLGNYDCCAWQVRGEGQFRALTGASPFIGHLGEVEKVPEYRVELVCSAERLTAALAALRAAHPYEEPAIDVWQLYTPV